MWMTRKQIKDFGVGDSILILKITPEDSVIVYI